MQGLTKTDAVYDYVKNAILQNQLVEHEKLSERVLCEKFNTSRTTIRVAIAKLKDDGWVYSKAKSGTYIADINQEKMIEYYQIRMLLEPSIIVYAFVNLTESDLKRLKENCEFMANCNDDEYRKLEIENHKIIGNRCSNKTLVKIVENMQDMYERLVARNSRNLLRRKAGLHEWQRILSALENKDIEMVKQCMVRHVLNGMDEYLNMSESTEDVEKLTK